MMLDQTEEIHRHEWDNLIIFDACRYDAFQMKYQDFLDFDGELSEAWSPNSCTKEWLHETWTEKYPDVTYISSNMFMRSRPGGHQYQFKHPERFGRIIDAYLVSLYPEVVDKYALVIKGRKVLHYLAPQKPMLVDKRYDYDGYLANLECIMQRMSNVIPQLEGKTVITADHGEQFRPDGESDGHRCNRDHPDLRTVPWFVVKERKQ